MKRSRIVQAHLVATVIAILTIGSFFGFSLTAEIIGQDLFIKKVKTGILYALPILVIAMPILGLTGKKLAGNSTRPMVTDKMKRMKLIAMNGVLLILLAIYLYYHAHHKTIDKTFLIVQMVELSIGAANLVLIGKNVLSGLMLSGKIKK